MYTHCYTLYNIHTHINAHTFIYIYTCYTFYTSLVYSFIFSGQWLFCSTLMRKSNYIHRIADIFNNSEKDSFNSREREQWCIHFTEQNWSSFQKEMLVNCYFILFDRHHYYLLYARSTGTSHCTLLFNMYELPVQPPLMHTVANAFVIQCYIVIYM